MTKEEVKEMMKKINQQMVYILSNDYTLVFEADNEENAIVFEFDENGELFCIY